KRRAGTDDYRCFILEGGRLGSMPEGVGGTASPEDLTTASSRGARCPLSLRGEQTRGHAHGSLTACYPEEPRLILARMTPWGLGCRHLRSDLIGDDPLVGWACKLLRTKYFHGVSSGNPPPYLLKSRYGTVSVLRSVCPKYTAKFLRDLGVQSHPTEAPSNISTMAGPAVRYALSIGQRTSIIAIILREQRSTSTLSGTKEAN